MLERIRRGELMASEDHEGTAGSAFWFSALYQGSPTMRGGGWIRTVWLTGPNAIGHTDGSWSGAYMVRDGDLPLDLSLFVRSWDEAATQGGGDYTAGMLWAFSPSQRLFFILDHVRGQWSSAPRDAVIKAVALSDNRWGERYRQALKPLQLFQLEGGSSGKDRESAVHDLLPGCRVEVHSVTGDKLVRADGMRSAAEAGRIRMRMGPWNGDLLAAAARFPLEPDDDIDAGSFGYNRIARGHTAAVVEDNL